MPRKQPTKAPLATRQPKGVSASTLSGRDFSNPARVRAHENEIFHVSGYDHGHASARASMDAQATEHAYATAIGKDQLTYIDQKQM